MESPSPDDVALDFFDIIWRNPLKNLRRRIRPFVSLGGGQLNIIWRAPPVIILGTPCHIDNGV